MEITAQQAEDLALISKADADDIGEVDRLLASLPKYQLRPSRLLKAAATGSVTPDLARLIVRQGLFLCFYARSARAESADVVSALQKALIAHGWTASQVKEGRQHWYALSTLVENENIYSAAKALELSFDHSRLMTSAKIITDIRPVLNRHRDSPVGAVIFNTLKLEYFENDEVKEVAVVTTREDLEAIMLACKEALEGKLSAVGRLVADATDDNVFAYGEESYGFTET